MPLFNCTFKHLTTAHPLSVIIPFLGLYFWTFGQSVTFGTFGNLGYKTIATTFGTLGTFGPTLKKLKSKVFERTIK